MTKTKKFIIILLIIIITFSSIVFSKKPSLNRDWSIDQKILAEISFSGSLVNIKNIRDFKYSSTDDYKVHYYDETFDLDKIKKVYYIIEPFSKYEGPAHTMFSFEFEDGKFVTISPEIRKEKGEEFSAINGILNKYELVYMIGSENDLVKLRANYRKDEVFVYPIKAYNEDIRYLFNSMIRRAEKLAKNPEFYNTLTNNCASNILKHVNDIRINDIPRNKYVILPSQSDKIIYNFGLIDTSLNLEKAREYYKINKLSRKYGDNPDYSKLIRKEIK